MRNTLMLLFLFLIGGTLHINAQTISIKTTDGSESTNLISTVHKLSFANNMLILWFADGATSSFDVSEINKIYFNDVVAGVNLTSDNKNGLVLYPNPAVDYLNFKNLENQNISYAIYRMDGKVMLKSQLSSEYPSIDIRSLPAGIFIIQLNKQMLKLIKQ